MPVAVTSNIEFVRRGSRSLTGDLYFPSGGARVPIMIAIHGGGWKRGDKAFYRFIGPYLAERGIAVFSVNYRLVDPETGADAYPAAVHDVRAAVQYVRSRAHDLNIDPDRIALMGDSAGGHLSALVALAGDRKPFAGTQEEAFPGVSSRCKAVVGVYGVYDLVAQWRHDQISRPRDQISEIFVGRSPIDDREVFYEASPLTYATTAGNKTSFLLVWGESDDVVDHTTQSVVMLEALQQAKYFVRTVIMHDAPHFWISDPLDEHDSFSARLMPRLYRFLSEQL